MSSRLAKSTKQVPGQSGRHSETCLKTKPPNTFFQNERVSKIRRGLENRRVGIRMVKVGRKERDGK